MSCRSTKNNQKDPKTEPFKKLSQNMGKIGHVYYLKKLDFTEMIRITQKLRKTDRIGPYF